MEYIIYIVSLIVGFAIGAYAAARYYYEGGVMPWNIKEPCPYRHKFDLIEWAKKKWPNEPVSKWKFLRKDELYARWYKSV